jgi:hypothetical protein
MAKKKIEEDEEDDDIVDDEEEEDDFEEGRFVCRVCNKETTLGEGDDMILVCDNCADKYDIDIDKIWAAYDAEKILDEQLKTFDLTPYMKKKPGAGKKTSTAAPKKSTKK